MFKYDSAAKAYLAASNDLLEEIEGKGYDVWATLDSEWKSRQDVLDAGPTGNYHQVVSNNRLLAVVGLTTAVVCLVTYQMHKRRAQRDVIRRYRLERKDAA
jgi:hypothetical protein